MNQPTLTDWVQAVASIAAFFVAAVAIWIAHGASEAEKRQADAARQALDIAVRSDRARQREAQILAITPMLAPQPGLKVVPGRSPVALFRYRLPASVGVFGMKVMLRRDGLAGSLSHDMGAISPGGTAHVTMTIDMFGAVGPGGGWTPSGILMSSSSSTPERLGST